MTLEDVGPDNWRHCLGKQAAEQIANSNSRRRCDQSVIKVITDYPAAGGSVGR
jgi:hypothetical protein